MKWKTWIMVIVVALGICIILANLFANSVRNDNITITITEKAIEQECDYISYIEGSIDTIDCYADIYYNRIEHLNKSGMHCFFSESGNFLTRCKR